MGLNSTQYDLVKASAAITVTTQTPRFYCGLSRALRIYYRLTAITGTTPSVTPVYQESPDGTKWFDVMAGTAMTATGDQIITVPYSMGPYYRIDERVSGTTPSITSSIDGSQY